MFSKDIGIDLGTANTLVYMKGKGIVTVSYTHLDVYKRQSLNRPCGIAVNRISGMKHNHLSKKEQETNYALPALA